jgi:catechol 2,3-dioxygenase-like lactoylglutathione lyase family enzyme
MSGLLDRAGGRAGSTAVPRIVRVGSDWRQEYDAGSGRDGRRGLVVARQEGVMARVKRLQHTSVPMPPGGETEARWFYGQVLGMVEKQPPTSLSSLKLVWFRAGDDEVHVFEEESLGLGSTSQHLCLEVDDLAEYRDRCKQHGVAVDETLGIRNRPRFFVRDPFGNQIELTQVDGPYDGEV